MPEAQGQLLHPSQHLLNAGRPQPRREPWDVNARAQPGRFTFRGRENSSKAGLGGLFTPGRLQSLVKLLFVPT